MDFTKVSDGSVRLTGAQKAAVLLCELGSHPEGQYLVSYIYKRLELTPKEKRLLTKAISNLGAYDPFNPQMVKRENAVLEFFLSWGKRKGFKVKEVTDFEKAEKLKMSTDDFKDLKENPEKVSEILKSWLKE